MIRSLLPAILLSHTLVCGAQPDTLWVPMEDTVHAYQVMYGPLRDTVAFTHFGRYAFDTTRVAVRLGYKRGKPSGVYRAFFPDGRPLIFAVYGWGSLHGDWTEYDTFGHITLKGQYRMGKREGTWAFRKEGIVGHYKNGMKHGKWRYYKDGKVAWVEKYHKDQLKQGSTYRILGMKLPGK